MYIYIYIYKTLNIYTYIFNTGINPVLIITGKDKSYFQST